MTALKSSHVNEFFFEVKVKSHQILPHKWTTKFIPNLSLVKIKKFAVVLIEDTHHLCKRFSFDGIETMSRGISWGGGGGKQMIKFENMSNRGRVC